MKYKHLDPKTFDTSDLSGDALKIANIICEFMSEYACEVNKQNSYDDPLSYNGYGCKLFHDGNSLGWGDSSTVLTLVYEGSDFSDFFSFDACYESYDMTYRAMGNGCPAQETFYFKMEALLEKLSKAGFLMEQYNTCVNLVYRF